MCKHSVVQLAFPAINTSIIANKLMLMLIPGPTWCGGPALLIAAYTHVIIL